MKLTTTDIVRAINDLPKNIAYRYVNQSTKTNVIIHEITLPEGPIWVKRYNPEMGEGPAAARPESISTQMIARIANAFIPEHPINFDRVLGGSYNTRSCLEALMAHTPQFYTCLPGRLDSYTGQERRGHKHLMWCPNQPHKRGEITEKDTKIVISEMPTHDMAYDSLAIPDELLVEGVDPDIQRMHARIQIALLLIGIKLGFKVWVAKNDRNLIYKDKPIREIEGVLHSLRDEKVVISNIENAPRAAALIDVIWFQNNRFMPVVMEIEHTTGVTSGLTRMFGLYNRIPAFQTRYVIVAPDENRQKVVTEIKRDEFAPLNARYFPYSSVEELGVLCHRRNIKGITQDFIDSYIEEV